MRRKTALQGLLPFLMIFLLCSCSQSTAEPSEDQDISACSEQSACTFESSEESSSVFTEISFEQAIEDMEEGKSGIYYFHFDACPWCQALKPILEEAAKETDAQIYSVYTRDSDGERLYSDEQKDRITRFLREAMSENDEGELTLYVPLIAVIKDGVLMDWHVGTLQEHDATKDPLTSQQKQQLAEILTEMLKTQKETFD